MQRLPLLPPLLLTVSLLLSYIDSELGKREKHYAMNWYFLWFNVNYIYLYIYDPSSVIRIGPSLLSRECWPFDLHQNSSILQLTEYFYCYVFWLLMKHAPTTACYFIQMPAQLLRLRGYSLLSDEKSQCLQKLRCIFSKSFLYAEWQTFIPYTFIPYTLPDPECHTLLHTFQRSVVRQ